MTKVVTTAGSSMGEKGHHGYDDTGQHVITPDKGRTKPQSHNDANRANAQLKTWRILRKLGCCPRRAGRLAKAIHVLQNYEITAG